MEAVARGDYAGEGLASSSGECAFAHHPSLSLVVPLYNEEETFARWSTPCWRPSARIPTSSSRGAAAGGRGADRAGR